MKNQVKYVGIDISKDYFDVAIPNEKGYVYHQLPNTLKGFSKLLKMVSTDHWAVLEASGPYYLKLACYLQENNIAVSVVNPLIIRRFCQMRLVRAKTDKKDAQMIAEYGKTEQPTVWTAEKPHIIILRQIMAVLSQFTKHRTALENQKQAIEQMPYVSESALESIENTLGVMEEETCKMEAQMKQIIDEHYSEEYRLLQSVPGIGPKTALVLIVVTDGFTRFASSKQLIAYLGLCPRVYNSGKTVRGKGKITKMGAPKARASLYMCVYSAKRCNKACKEMHERLIANGKNKKVANIAVANKLVRQAFAVVTKKEIYKAA